MDEDALPEEYRKAVRAHPELAPASLRPRREAAPGSTHAAEAEGVAADDGRFPPKYESPCLIAETRLSRTWRARDQERQTDVVIKEPQARLLVDRDAEERFRAEVRLASRLMHPNIVPILTTHLSEPPWFFTMPLVEGRHLDEFCEDRQLSLKQRLQLFLRICDAVTHAHQHRVIHRDLKPGNILVSEEGEPQLLDFGVGTFLDADGASTGGGEQERVLGSPGYMAPEQAQGLPVDVRTDVYALGVILYQLLTGRLPIEPCSEPKETLERIGTQDPLPPRALCPRLHRDLNAIVLKALSKQPAARYQSVSDLVHDIDNHLGHRPVAARPWSTGVALLKWLRRNWGRAALGGAALLALFIFAVLFGVMIFNATRTTLERQAKAMAMGRLQTARDDPVAASTQLWCGYLAHDSHRTRFALWEFYRRYPCLRAFDLEPQRDVEYAPDGEWLATVGVDGSLCICNARTGACMRPLPPGGAAARCIKFASRPAGLYVGGSDGTLRIWSFSSEKGALGATPLHVFEVPGETVTALAVAPSGRWLSAGVESPAAGGDAGEVDTCICLWDTGEQFTLVRTWRLPRERVHALAFSANEAKLAAATRRWGVGDDANSGSLLLWHLAAPDGPERLLSTPAPCRAAAFSDDGQHLFCCTNHLRSLSPAGEVETLLSDTPRWGIRSAAMLDAETGSYLALAGGDGRVRFYDVARRRLLPVQGFHDVVAEHVDVCFSPGGETLASASYDGLRIWRFPPAAARRIPCDAPSVETQICVSRGAQTVVASAEASGGEWNIFIWRRSERDPALEPLGLSSVDGHMALTADGRWLALMQPAAPSPQLAVIDLSNPRDAITLPVDLDVQAKPFWLDGAARVLLLACSDGALRLWRCAGSDVARFSELEVIHRFDSVCTCVTVDASGRWLAASAEGPRGSGQVALWRASGLGVARHAFAEAYSFHNAFATHAYTWNVALVTGRNDRLVLATSGSARHVHLWDAESGVPLGPLCNQSPHSDAVFQCLPLNQRLLVTASRDDTVRIWDVRKREEVCILHRSRNRQASIAVAGGSIAVADGETIMATDVEREIERFLAGNRAYEMRRLGSNESRR